MSSDASPYPGVRSFAGDSLREVAFPLGGIGTGTVSLGGRGNLRDWEIFNRPAKGKNLPYTFFSIWAKPADGAPVARVLERRLLPPFGGGSGPSTAFVSGLPRLREARFSGGYPLAWIDFEDDALPLEMRLNAFNPFVPMNDLDSGIPCAIFEWDVRNPGSVNIEATIAFSLFNACGYDGMAGLYNRRHDLFGQNLNEFIRDGALSGIRMGSAKYAADHAQFGTLAMATPMPNVTWATRWERAGWWDDVQSFWDDFREDGMLSNGPDADPTPDGQTDVGSLGVRVTVRPGQTVRIPFVMTWHFPGLTNYWNDEAAVKGKRLGTWYGSQWPDAWAVARYVGDNLDRLREETHTFFRAFHESTLPGEVLDAASANASTIRTTTCLRTADGRFHAFEGCGDNGGCCPMNCTHVWNYEQALAFLFPALERSVRYTDFQHNTRGDGYMAFRTLLPLVGELWAFKPAADGQMGTVMKVYREWLNHGDRQFLEDMWPGVVKALEHAWRPGSWDADRDGVMEGEQHNTYDIEFYGPNTMMGTFYLGALRAAEEMAKALGHADKAAEYRAVFEKGSAKTAGLLWNGEYFKQIVEVHGAQAGDGVVEGLPGSLQEGETEPRYQYGEGCLADHMLGQWFARVVGLGDLLPVDKVKSAVGAIFRHNFRHDLSDHHSVQRVYAVNDEAGLLLCSWPNGGRPAYPFPYADEVWTGIEYQVAAHLMYEGLLDEGLAIVKAIRSRHAGFNRNPWNEFECGHHYARAMASWSLITALSGALYDAADQCLGFAPRLCQDEFRSFFTAGTAWGSFAQTRGVDCYEAELGVRWGEVTLRALRLPIGPVGHVTVELDGTRVAATVLADEVRFGSPLALKAGQTVRVTFA